MSRAFRIRDVRVFTMAPASGAGTYFRPGAAEHWLVDSLIANPMSGYAKYRDRRSSWGIGVIGALVIEIETEDGTVGVATGSGGVPAAWIIRHHFARFLVGEDARNINRIWDQLYRASLPYGRKGLAIMAISAVDLALWDLVGKVRKEPVYNLIGGLSRDEITFYCTGPDALAIKGMGFWGAKVPLPHSHFDGEDGMARNLPGRASRGRGAGFPADGRLLHVADRKLCHSPGRSGQTPEHPLVGRSALARRQRRLPRDQARTPDVDVDDGRARVYPVRLSPADR
jgi:L-rhamnonate dehydratase